MSSYEIEMTSIMSKAGFNFEYFVYSFVKSFFSTKHKTSLCYLIHVLVLNAYRCFAWCFNPEPTDAYLRVNVKVMS